MPCWASMASGERVSTVGRVVDSGDAQGEGGVLVRGLNEREVVIRRDLVGRHAVGLHPVIEVELGDRAVGPRHGQSAALRASEEADLARCGDPSAAAVTADADRGPDQDRDGDDEFVHRLYPVPGRSPGPVRFRRHVPRLPSVDWLSSAAGPAMLVRMSVSAWIFSMR